MKKRDSIEYYDTHWSNERAYKNGYAKGVKEFANRLKEMASQGFWETNSYVGTDQIDDLVKEMVGADNG